MKKYRGPCVFVLWIDGPKKGAEGYFIKKLSTGKEVANQVNPKANLAALKNALKARKSTEEYGIGGGGLANDIKRKARSRKPSPSNALRP
jgi:hypothetical protein